MIDKTAALVWHAFIQASPQQFHSLLIQTLAPELAAVLTALPPHAVNVSDGVSAPEEQLLTLHASWFAPFLRGLPEQDIQLFLSALAPFQIETLQKSLLSSADLPEVSALGKEYLRHTLFHNTAAPIPMSIDTLPETPFNPLLDLSSKELLSLVELLSMHDLSSEIRQIIDNKKLKEVYAALTKAQTAFLQTLLHKKEAVSFKKIGIAQWTGDKDALRALLLQRGINRLAKALFGQENTLIWHIAHRLDMEQGTSFLNLCTAFDHPIAAELLAEQLLELVHAIKNHNPSSSP